MFLGRLHQIARPVGFVAQRCCSNPRQLTTLAKGYWRTPRFSLLDVSAIVGAGVGCVVMQNYFGTAENFFQGKFITDKHPDDLAEFYQAEELLKIIAMHPILFEFFMSKTSFDTEEATEETALLSTEESHVNVSLLGMEVSFEIIEREEETADGQSVLASFRRHERFIDYVPLLSEFMDFVSSGTLSTPVKILLWDQTWNYGFNRLPDGKVEVYHQGEKFYGPWPVRLIVFLHQYYVLRACEKHINSPLFGSGDEEMLQEQISNIPMHVLGQYYKDKMAEQQQRLEARRAEWEAVEKKVKAREESDRVNRLKQDIADAEAALQKLGKLHKKPKPISVVRRQSTLGSHAKLVVADEDTQDILQHDKSAMEKLVRNADLQWGTRSKSNARAA